MQQPVFSDSHCHIYAEEFSEDRDAVVQRAIEAGIKRIFLPNIDLSSYRPMLDLSTRWKDTCFPMLGLHPCSVKENYLEILEELWQKRNESGFVGIGETGIDLYWDNTFLLEQKQALRIQAEWAKELDIPLILHVRDSFDEVCSVLDEVNDSRLKGIFHCFTGTVTQAQKVINFGNFYLGVGGVSTFRNSNLVEVLKEIGMDKIVLETDAPYLAPVPFRGKRNEPSYVLHIASHLCTALEIPIYELSSITERNIDNLFGKA